MSETGINKISNPARPFSILAMIILCISLAIFFIQFATKFSTGLFWKNTIRISGTLSMIFAILIFTKYHDLMTILSSFFAVFVVAGIIRQIYKSKMTLFKISGIVCIVFLVLNNYIYYSEHFIKVLPLLQKITFAFILIWILGLNHKLIHYNSINKTT
ncbi:hypothetical protein [Aquimarina longa]|uniref:hypothetical protein n=1 Tax=Aquimarina longa TaxID=1080221 RepID=UPI001F0805B3|nr:hypothetical protein [Aquimarina longa]